MQKFIVTTTINRPTKALKKFDAMSDWHLIVVGDRKTPSISLRHGTYLSPNEQLSLGFGCAKQLPWNIIQRRNIGYLYALQQGADIIATVDDDNIPLDNWGLDLPGKEYKLSILDTTSIVCDPLFLQQEFLRGAVSTNYLEFESSESRWYPDLKLWHRGFPIQLLDERQRTQSLEPEKKLYIDVGVGLWEGEPDVDAVCRIAQGPFDFTLGKKTQFIVKNTKFSPFNTQNTFFTRRVAPCMCLAYDIGRMDDIWASYMTERVMRELDTHVAYFGSSVRQERNDHDLTIDLQQEMHGYKHTLSFIRALDKLELGGSTSIELYSSLVEGIADLPYISKEMTSFQRAWIDDVARIV